MEKRRREEETIGEKDETKQDKAENRKSANEKGEKENEKRCWGRSSHSTVSERVYHTSPTFSPFTIT